MFLEILGHVKNNSRQKDDYEAHLICTTNYKDWFQCHSSAAASLKELKEFLEEQ